jgi:hypothetical protein
MTALGDHAIAELAYQGVEEPAKTNITTIVGAFAEFPDELIPQVYDQVGKLLNQQPLSELTNEPSQWVARDDIMPGQQVWQSKRWPDAWTYDPQFRTYFLMSEHNGPPNSHTTITVGG